MSAAVLMSAILLAAVLATAGAAKLLDLEGSRRAVARSAFHGGSPRRLIRSGPARAFDAGDEVNGRNLQRRWWLWAAALMALGLAGLLTPPGAGAGRGGGRVLFLAGKKIWTIPPAGGTARPIHRDGDGIDAFAATPSGRLIVYASGKQVFRLRGDGSRLRLVRAFSDREANSIDVSADGQRILATLVRGTREKIVTFRADGRGNVRTLVGGLRFPDGDAEFSPDRRWIVYARGTPSRIFKLRVGGGIPILLHGNGEDPTYSPNGQRIAFAVPDMGLWTIKADGSNPQQFFNKQELGTDNPTYSPNGQRIAFDALPETGSFISTVRINGTNQKRLSERGSNPEWTRGPF